jgi:hypothetical protein
LTSTYLEGTECSLAAYGYSRDKKKGKLQIVFGVLCDKRGCPIAVEVVTAHRNREVLLTSTGAVSVLDEGKEEGRREGGGKEWELC